MSQNSITQREDRRIASSSETMLEVSNLKTYYDEGGLFGGKPVKAVDGVSFEIKQGETLGLVGESGCGKTTLGRTLIQLEEATGGKMRFKQTETVREYARRYPERTVSLRDVDDDADPLTVFQNEPVTPEEFGYADAENVPIADLVAAGYAEELGIGDSKDFVFIIDGDPDEPDSITDGFVEITRLHGEPQRRMRGGRTAMVFQDPDSSLNDRMTIGEIIQEPLDVHDWKTPRERQQRVRALLDTVGLDPEHYYRYPHQFSGGQRQRIGIARTLALNPDFIVLDEPVSALDVSVQAEIINLLEDLQAEFNLTYLFIAHDLSVVRHICDRVAVMYLGNIMEIGPTEELFNDPANPYTHALLSAIPEPDPTVERDRITLHGTPPNPRYPPSGCPFSTRCPAYIRAPQYDHVDDDVWTQINTFRELLRERERADRSLRERLYERLGRETRFATIDETVEELFGHLDVSEDVHKVLDDAAERAKHRDDEAALELLDEEFGSVCDGICRDDDRATDSETEDSIEPSFYTISESGHKSYCHRHDERYEDPDPVLDERH